MGREVRRVPPDWKHPEVEGRYLPLFKSYAWTQDPTLEVEDCMPNWPKEAMTHYQMYESTSEGTPISPVFASKAALARWLVSHKASLFGRHTASYETWMEIIEAPENQ